VSNLTLPGSGLLLCHQRPGGQHRWSAITTATVTGGFAQPL